jgi:hypothetical protein
MISEKTLNSLMEDLTVIYETRAIIGLIDYTIHPDRSIRCHFQGFGSLAAAMLTGILSRYAEPLVWCVQPSGCHFMTVEIDIFGVQKE